MYKVAFKAKFAYASKEEDEEYFMVGLSEDEFDYEKYILFQKSYDKEESEDIFIECNGDQCINCCTHISISNTTMILHIEESEISIDIEHVILPENFINYLMQIFGDILQVKD
ncbi:Imm10 family immunity protein [Sphingobacterium spiritivorum]|uniref:Immunity protein 10 n=1 Tax=Sphingobacterium spiritivorum ATCC 33861 TaxID=525373 RepID=D7VJ97_SPHSI|nr:Imm10 family immunity protein [Sphingobacterium spiritivorum]EFK58950.1 hypothetical protein HMPREF0766_11066 [Sphingobacterium spiritivorum ATCC 33861]QQT36812.1 hypothetical protein I6J01_05130 [Sphingobacterium spiritivorum]WQD33568.1 Imm10 family immunity protein [Sphingobacterium spiritivorum]SUJ25069.1 Uncharacterised protein [Sphingobacterium spiritivorum]